MKESVFVLFVVALTYYLLKEKIWEGPKGGTIKCNSCSWSWNEKDGGDDMYVCHKCGNDNSNMYNQDK